MQGFFGRLVSADRKALKRPLIDAFLRYQSAVGTVYGTFGTFRHLVRYLSDEIRAEPSLYEVDLLLEKVRFGDIDCWYEAVLWRMWVTRCVDAAPLRELYEYATRHQLPRSSRSFLRDSIVKELGFTLIDPSRPLVLEPHQQRFAPLLPAMRLKIVGTLLRQCMSNDRRLDGALPSFASVAAEAAAAQARAEGERIGVLHPMPERVIVGLDLAASPATTESSSSSSSSPPDDLLAEEQQLPAGDSDEIDPRAPSASLSAKNDH